MLTKLKANILFHRLLKRPDINKAYAMVGPEDSWYATITKVHQSLAEIQALPHERLSITSHDGLRLEGIYYPADSAEAVTVICATATPAMRNGNGHSPDCFIIRWVTMY